MSDVSLRLRRSVLYLPASHERALARAATLACDALILDLEDAVAPAAKLLARQQAVAAASAGCLRPREVVIRSNGLDTPWGADDLRAIAVSGADAVLLPKIDGPDDLAAAAAVLDQAGAPADLQLWAMIETPLAVLRLADIATSGGRLRCLVAGTSDLGRACRLPADPERLALLPWLSQMVLAARAGGLDVVDGVHVQLDDPAGLQAACEQGRRLGFDGKTLIHPAQIDIANQVFAPAPADIERARRIVSGWEEACARGAGITVVDGRLVEALHVDEARRCLALAARAGLL